MPDEIVELCGHHLLPVASNLSSGHHSEFDSLDVQSYFFGVVSVVERGSCFGVFKFGRFCCKGDSDPKISFSACVLYAVFGNETRTGCRTEGGNGPNF